MSNWKPILNTAGRHVRCMHPTINRAYLSIPARVCTNFAGKAQLTAGTAPVRYSMLFVATAVGSSTGAHCGVADADFTPGEGVTDEVEATDTAGVSTATGAARPHPATASTTTPTNAATPRRIN
jgi:hypothetical protein